MRPRFGHRLQDHARVRLGRSAVRRLDGGEHLLQTVHFLHVTDTPQGLAGCDAEQHVVARMQRVEHRAGAGIERIVIEPGKPARDLGLAVGLRHRRHQMGVLGRDKPPEGDIEGQPDDGQTRAPVRRGQPHRLEPHRQPVQDRVLTVDQRPVAIENDQIQGSVLRIVGFGVVLGGIEAEQVPALLHVGGQRRGDIDRAAPRRMRNDDAAGMQMQLVLESARELEVLELKYFGSPMIGWPIWAAWARSWCVRPVIGRRLTQDTFGPAFSTTE